MFCSTDIDPASVIRNGVGDILDKFHRHLVNTFSRDYSYTGRTRYALQFKLYRQPVELTVSPHWNKYDDYLSYIAGLGLNDRNK